LLFKLSLDHEQHQFLQIILRIRLHNFKQFVYQYVRFITVMGKFCSFLLAVNIF
jgi:hypothetical protein